MSIIAIIIAAVLALFSSAADGGLQPAVRGEQIQVVAPPPPPEWPEWPVSFIAFDCGWVQEELVDRNVKPDVVDFLMAMVERE
jgi:hypothetical protein